MMKLGMNHPMGPLTLADFIGLDTCLSIMEVLYSGLGDSKYRPCPLLRKYVKAGWLGKRADAAFINMRRGLLKVNPSGVAELHVTQEQVMMRKMVRDFARKEIAPAAKIMEETDEFPLQLIKNG